MSPLKIKMINKKMTKNMKRSLLIVSLLITSLFAVVLINEIVWVSAAYEICPTPLPESIGLGNLSLEIEGEVNVTYKGDDDRKKDREEVRKARANNEGSAKAVIKYEDINVPFNTSLSYCGAPQVYSISDISGTGEGASIVRNKIQEMAKEYSGNNLTTDILARLRNSRNLRFEGIMSIEGDMITYDALLNFKKPIPCEVYENHDNRKECKTLGKTPISYQRPITVNGSIEKARNAETFVNDLRTSFENNLIIKSLSDINTLDLSILDFDCCNAPPEVIICSSDVDCPGTPSIVGDFCDGANIVTLKNAPSCFNPGTTDSFCDFQESIVGTEPIFCNPLNWQACVEPSFGIAKCLELFDCSAGPEVEDPFVQDSMITFPEGYELIDECLDSTTTIEYLCMGLFEGLGFADVITYDCATEGMVCWDGACSASVADTNSDGVTTMSEILDVIVEGDSTDIEGALIIESIKTSDI